MPTCTPHVQEEHTKSEIVHPTPGQLGLGVISILMHRKCAYMCLIDQPIQLLLPARLFTIGHRYIELFLNSSDDPVAAMAVAPGGGQIVRPPAVAVGGAVISAPGVGLAQQQQYTYGYDTSMHGRPTGE